MGDAGSERNYERNNERKGGGAIEDKQEILNALLPALALTRRWAGILASLEYDPGREAVWAALANGEKKGISVAADSGIAMIRDVVGALS